MVEIGSAIKSPESSNTKDELKNIQDSNLNTPDLDLELIEQVRDLVRAELERDSSKYSKRHYDEIMDEESPLVCWRYIIHCGKKVNDTVELIKSSLIWRQENDFDEFDNTSMELVKDFWLISPIVKCGPDNDGNDVLYIIGKNYRKPDAIFKQVIKNFTKKILFGWDQRHRHDMRQLCLVFDTTDTGIRNIDLDFMSWLISIRDYLPVRFVKIYVIGIPFIVRPLVKLIISWLSENFRKIVFCGTYDELIAPNIPRDRLPIEVGGNGGDLMRLAPTDLPWASETETFSDPAMTKAVKESIGYAVDSDRLEKLRQMQLEHEKKISNK